MLLNNTVKLLYSTCILSIFAFTRDGMFDKQVFTIKLLLESYFHYKQNLDLQTVQRFIASWLSPASYVIVLAILYH